MTWNFGRLGLLGGAAGPRHTPNHLEWQESSDVKDLLSVIHSNSIIVFISDISGSDVVVLQNNMLTKMRHVPFTAGRQFEIRVDQHKEPGPVTNSERAREQRSAGARKVLN